MIFEKEESWDKMAILYANVEIIIRCATILYVLET